MSQPNAADLADEILRRIAAGETMKAIGRDPTITTLIRMTGEQREPWRNHFSTMRQLDDIIAQQRGGR